MAEFNIGELKRYLSHVFEGELNSVSIRGFGVGERFDMKGFG